MGYYTTKKCILGAVDGLIWTTSTQHLIIYIKVFKYILMKFIWRYLYLDRNLADMGYFRSTLASLLHQNAYQRLIWYSRAYTKVLMGSIVLACQNFVKNRQKNGVNSRENDQLNHKILVWSRIWLLNTFFLQINPQRSPNSKLINQVTPLVSLGGLLIIN